MSEGERARQQRYVFARHRHQALVARALVRTTLSRYSPGVRPQDWRFLEGEHGRPEIESPLSQLRFNLSHTSELMVCGVTLKHDIGVDVEDTRRKTEGREIAERFFSDPEVGQISQGTSFFDFWTLKESYLKARGAGLSLPLRQVSFFLDDPPRISVTFDEALRDEPWDWRFALLRPTSSHTAALAVRSRSPVLTRVRQVVPLRGEQRMACEAVARSW